MTPAQDTAPDLDAPTEMMPLVAQTDLPPDGGEPDTDWVPATSAATPEPTAELPTLDPPATLADVKVLPTSDDGLNKAAPQPRRRALRIVVTLLIVAVLAVGGYFVWDTVTKSMRDDAITTTAQTYLQGITDGDVAVALGTLQEQPADSTLLTNDVLAASVTASPITNATVDAITSDETNATADVSYTIGEADVNITLNLVGDGRTSWRITNGLTELTLSPTAALRVNGAVVDQPTYPVLPGTYTATPVTDRIALGEEASVLITDPLVEGATISPSYSVSETGREAILSTLTQDVDRCLASTESQMDGCPFGVDPGDAEVKPGSVRFDLKNDPWKDFAPDLDPTTLKATGTVTFDINVTATVTFDGRTSDAASLSMSVDRTWAVDLSQDALTVNWT